MLARGLIAASAAILFLLGSAHLLYTYWGPKLLPRDVGLIEAMQRTQLRLTAETTVWRAWIGFNASHSLCAILFGLIYGYLALAQPELLFRSLYLQAVGLGLLLAFVVLAKLYWFSIPFMGVGLALACYVGGLVGARV
ncbi:LIC_13387 family protein [Roseateles paludis]|uniref:DUF1304 domain-containing protein n=1 Tax=Roseateles paludis TaxID=3145238 RepID=A0ABV0FYG5_9BURK